MGWSSQRSVPGRGASRSALVETCRISDRGGSRTAPTKTCAIVAHRRSQRSRTLRAGSAVLRARQRHCVSYLITIAQVEIISS